MTVVEESAPPVTVPAQQPRPRWRALREIGLVVALFVAYKLGRIVADGHVSEAMRNARDVWHVERVLRLPGELAIQHATLAHVSLVHLANSYYAYVHFPATAVCLIWLYVWRPEHYLWTRRMLAWLTAAALVVHLLMPLAPPRMLTSVGMVDTGRLFGPAVYGSPNTDTLANQYAAMPSLHVGWAVVVAAALIMATRSRWRWAWLLHPVATLLVVVATGNHYWLDAIVALALLGLVAVVVPRGAGPAAGGIAATGAPGSTGVPAAPARRCRPMAARRRRDHRVGAGSP